MKKSIQLADFKFKPLAYGRYQVTYTSPITLKSFIYITDDIKLIDVTKNSDNPKKIHLNQLKKECKLN